MIHDPEPEDLKPNKEYWIKFEGYGGYKRESKYCVDVGRWYAPNGYFLTIESGRLDLKYVNKAIEIDKPDMD